MGGPEYVTHQSCLSRYEVNRFYHRLGGYLAAFYVLRGRDMHFDNVMAAEFPVPVDLETLLHNDALAGGTHDPAIDAFQSSVIKVMLLPQPTYKSETDVGVDMSGFGAKSGQPFRVGTTFSWERAGTDEMRLVHSKTAPTMATQIVRCWRGKKQPQQNMSKPSWRGFDGCTD